MIHRFTQSAGQSVSGSVRAGLCRRWQLVWCIAITAGCGIGNALAAPHWEAVTLADQGMFHLDSHSIVKEGHIRKFHSALDYKHSQSTSDGKSYLSSETHVQLDCNTRYARVVHLTLYSGRMLSGTVVLKEGILREWQPVVAASPMEKLANKVC